MAARGPFFYGFKTDVAGSSMNALIGIKQHQMQKFLQNGQRIPVTSIQIPGNLVMQIKTQEKDKYQSLQLGIGSKKLPKSPKSTTKTPKPRFLKEVKTTDETELPQVGATLAATSVFQPGDMVDVIGTSKGKGFAGGVKRYHFRGGPRTHGQSDRERAPGSIGQTTTPGRVYKGKRMAGHMGNVRVTVRNLVVVDVTDNELWLEGLVPGHYQSLLTIQKTGKTKKNFTTLLQDESKKPANEIEIEPELETVTKSTVDEDATLDAPVVEEQVETAATEEVSADSETTAVDEQAAELDAPVTSDETAPTESANEEKPTNETNTKEETK